MVGLERGKERGMVKEEKRGVMLLHVHSCTHIFDEEGNDSNERSWMWVSH
jgi:hypothetical protein